MATKKKQDRKTDILQALAILLEKKPGEKVTTAKLALQVGVSEAALYRHFPSKARMFEGLIDFIEATVFTQINLIKTNEKTTLDRIEHLMFFLLGFAEQNPGITRILTGDALLGENTRLLARIARVFSKLESQIKQLLREKAMLDGEAFKFDEAILANLLLSYVEGRIGQFVRTGFKQKPTTNFNEQWSFLKAQLLVC